MSSRRQHAAASSPELDEPGRQFPGKALQRRTVLPDDGNVAIRQRCDDGDVILSRAAQSVKSTTTSRSMIAIHGDTRVAWRALIFGQSSAMFSSRIIRRRKGGASGD
jgi:hypothetical protein